MLDQADNLKYCFRLYSFLDQYLFQEIVLSNPCFIFYKNMILSLIDNETIET